MPSFRVARNYSAVYQSRPIAFVEGVTVELDGEAADWVNRDSPECLVSTDAPVAAPVEEAEQVEEAPVEAEESTEADRPKRGRRGSA